MIGNILLGIVTFCTFVSYLPQAIEIIKTKSSEDISIISWILWVISSLCYTSYAIFFSGTGMLILGAIVELFFAVLILVLTIIYDKNK